MASDVECITLDDSDDNDESFISTASSGPYLHGAGGMAPSRKRTSLPGGGGIVMREEKMMRCNFCVDPGLLPVEVDRAAHRRKIHANKLFYCDVCTSGEKGSKGFEEFQDVVKHVAKENGLDERDQANVNDFIRIPKTVDYLKVFKCMFCPGEGMKFVGLSEETFLEHIHNKHGTKAPRRKPEKLVRECRICAGAFETDHELGAHINKRHIDDTREKKVAPFAGFGPRCQSDDSDSSDDEYQDPRMRPPPAPKNLSMKPKSPKRRSWDNETDRFLEKMTLPSAYRRPNDDHGGHSSQQKRRRVESDPDRRLDKCVFCGETSPELGRHLAMCHKADCFSCPEQGCEELAWVRLSQVTEHVATSRDHVRCNDPNELLARRRIKPPRSLESIHCMFCDPPSLIVGDTWLDMTRGKYFEHMEIHENIHRGSETMMRRNTAYVCRMCDKSWPSDKELETHMAEHKREASRTKRSLTPRGVDKRPRIDSREEGEVMSPRSPSPGRRRRSGGHSQDRDPRNRRNSSPAPSKSDPRRVSCKFCPASWPGDPDKSVMRKHREQHPNQHTSINDCFLLECGPCRQTFALTQGADFSNHVSGHSDTRSAAGVSGLGNIGKVQCSYCYELFDRNNIRRHISQDTDHVKDAFQCSNCPEVFITKPEVLHHLDFEHQVRAREADRHLKTPDQLQALLCLRCKWTLVGDDMDAMEFHFAVVHNDGKQFDASRDIQFFCRWCGKDQAFRNQRALEEHVKDHRNQPRKVNNFINSINKTLSSRAEDGYDRRRSDGRSDSRHDDRGGLSYDRRDESRHDLRDRRDSYGGDRRDRDRGGTKDGDWSCSKCSFNNFASRRNCKRCNEPNPDGGRDFGRRGRGGGRGRGRGGDGGGRGRGRGGPRGGGGRFGDRDRSHGDRPEDWNCLACNKSNFGNRTECFVCGVAKGEGKQQCPSAIDDMKSQIEAMFAMASSGIPEAPPAEAPRQSRESQEAVDEIIDLLINATVGDDQEDPEQEAAALASEDQDVTYQENVAQDLNNPQAMEIESQHDADADGSSSTNNDVDQDDKAVDNIEADSENSFEYETVVKVMVGSVDTSKEDMLAAPDSPDYAPADNMSDDEEEDVKPSIPTNNEEMAFKCKKCNEPFKVKYNVWDHLIEVHGSKDEDQLDQFVLDIDTPNPLDDAPEMVGVEDASVAQGTDMYECSMCRMTNPEMFEIYAHLETVHGVNDDEEELMRYVAKVPSAPTQAPVNLVSTNTTVDLSSETPVTMEEDTQDSTTTDTTMVTQRSSSPVNVHTVQELKEAIAKDDWNFVVHPEVQGTEEYQRFCDDYKKEHGVDFNTELSANNSVEEKP